MNIAHLIINRNLKFYMNIALNNSLIESYSKYFQKLDLQSKKQLIIKLTESIGESSDDSYDFSACFGAWDDDRSAQEIFDDIKKDRNNAREPEELL
jgi:hypothetical protein